MVVLLFHKLTPRPEIGISWHSPVQFEKIIGRLKASGFTNGRSDELSDTQTDTKKLLITFDDGYEGIYQFALPILKNHGFTALVFLIAGYFGKKSFWDMNVLGRYRHLDWDQVLELQKAGFEFGSHTMTHPDLTFISAKRLEWELKGSKSILEERLGAIPSLSYPFGRYNNEVKQATQEAGYELAFTIHPRAGDEPFDPFARKRIPVRYIDPWWLVKEEILRPDSLVGRFGQARGKLINFLSRGTTLVRKKDYKNELSLNGRTQNRRCKL